MSRTSSDCADHQDLEDELDEELAQPPGRDDLGPVGLRIDAAHHGVTVVEPVGNARVGRAVPDHDLHEEEEDLAEPVRGLREDRLVLQLMGNGDPEAVEEVINVENRDREPRIDAADEDGGDRRHGKQEQEPGDPDDTVRSASPRQLLEDLTVHRGSFPILALEIPLESGQLFPGGESCRRHA